MQKPDQLTDRARRAAEEILNHIKKGAPNLDLCLVSQSGDCRDFKGCVDHAGNVLAAIIKRHCRESPGTSVIRWTRYDGTPETLPKHFLTILRFTDEYGFEVISRTYKNDEWVRGDLWVYLPNPQEGME